jgi:hypothetical protein
MSHYSIYKTTLGNLNKQFMMQCIQALAKQIGAQLTSKVDVYGSQRFDVAIALKTKDLPNGIGFGVDETGHLTIHGDSYQYGTEYHRIQSLAENFIKAYQVATTARKVHPQSRCSVKALQHEVILEVAGI